MRGGGYNRPKAAIGVVDFVLLKRHVGNTLGVAVSPHILKVVALQGSGVAVLQGADGATISHQLSNMTPCSVLVADTKFQPGRYVHCRVCGSKSDAAVMLLCDACNRGFHIWCLKDPLPEVPIGHWYCEEHQVSSYMFRDGADARGLLET